MKPVKLTSRKELKIISNSESQTKSNAKNLAKILKGGEVLCLYGELGSGKTTFVKGLAKGLGIKERITSPTFILHRSYNAVRAKPLQLHHIDLYRIQSPKDIESLGLEELFQEKNSIIAIEWAEKIKAILPKNRIEIYLKYLDEDKRAITIHHE